MRTEFPRHIMNADKDRGPGSSSLDECCYGYQMNYLALAHNHTTEEVRRMGAHGDLRLGPCRSEDTEMEAQDDLKLESYYWKHTRMDLNNADYRVR